MRAAGVDPVLCLQVHLMVAVVGRLFQKWFPAQPNLSYTYIWDKTDAYGQRVYGLSEAVGEFSLSEAAEDSGWGVVGQAGSSCSTAPPLSSDH